MRNHDTPTHVRVIRHAADENISTALAHHDEGSPIAAVDALERARAFALLLPGRAAEPVMRRINRIHEAIVDSIVVAIPDPVGV